MRFKTKILPMGLLGLAMALAFTGIPSLSKGQLRDSSRTAVSIGLVNNLTYGKVDYQAIVERNLSKKVSVLGSYGFNPRSKPENLYLWRFSWTVAAEGRYYFAVRNRLLMSGAYAGIYACHDRLGFFFDHTTQPRIKSRWTSIGPTLGYQQVLWRRLQLNAGIMFLFFQREVEKSYNRQGDLTRKKIYPSNYSYNYHISIGFRL